MLMFRYFLICAFILAPNIAFAFGVAPEVAPEPDSQHTHLASHNIYVEPNKDITLLLKTYGSQSIKSIVASILK